MNKKIKFAAILAIIIITSFFVLRYIGIRTVNYEIAGVKIPSVYNVFTGKVTPIKNYSGNTNLPTVQPHTTTKMGLNNDEVAMAQFRWAVFEEWANAHSEFKGWQENPELFKKANEEFLKQMQSRKGKIVLVR